MSKIATTHEVVNKSLLAGFKYHEKIIKYIADCDRVFRTLLMFMQLNVASLYLSLSIFTMALVSDSRKRHESWSKISVTNLEIGLWILLRRIIAQQNSYCQHISNGVCGLGSEYRYIYLKSPQGNDSTLATLKLNIYLIKYLKTVCSTSSQGFSSLQLIQLLLVKQRLRFSLWFLGNHWGISLM